MKILSLENIPSDYLVLVENLKMSDLRPLLMQESLPHAHLAERWAQMSIQLALSCSSRHYAGRSLQIFRALRVPISSRVLTDILSRLVETIAGKSYLC